MKYAEAVEKIRNEGLTELHLVGPDIAELANDVIENAITEMEWRPATGGRPALSETINGATVKALWVDEHLIPVIIDATRREAPVDDEPESDFGWALDQLRHGMRVCREGWNGKGMWLELQYPDDYSKMTLPYIFMSTAQGDLVPWLASQTDVLAFDWQSPQPKPRSEEAALLGLTEETYEMIKRATTGGLITGLIHEQV